MLTALALSLALQQAAGSAVVWETPAPAAEPELAPASKPVQTHLPDWALADPFGWERSQCSPLVSREPLDVCQTRVRAQLAVALGDQLPAGLRRAGEPVPCLATPADDGKYPVQCGVPERRAEAAVPPTIQDCRSRPTRQGASVAFVTDCGAQGQAESGLSFRLSGRD